MRRLYAELHRREPLLMAGGFISLVLGLMSLALIPFDPRTILGIDPWIKPAKFFFSIAIYLWTVAWLMQFVERRGAVRWVPGTVAVSMLVEMVCIVMQSVRGVGSHFNAKTAFDAIVFSTMGYFIIMNTIAIVVLLVALFRRATVDDRALLWAIRLGLIVFLLGSLEAGFMLARNRHTVGAKDGGPGLPFVNWSTQHGDLRVAHFLGIHAMQLLPMLAIAIRRRGPERARVAAIFIVTIVYVGLVAWLVIHALADRPLLAI